MNPLMRTSCVDCDRLELAAPLPVHAQRVMTLQVYQPIHARGANAFRVRSCGKRLACGFKGKRSAKVKNSIFTDRGNSGPSAFNRRRATCLIAGVALLARVSAPAPSKVSAAASPAPTTSTPGSRSFSSDSGSTRPVISSPRNSWPRLRRPICAGPK